MRRWVVLEARLFFQSHVSVTAFMFYWRKYIYHKVTIKKLLQLINDRQLKFLSLLSPSLFRPSLILILPQNWSFLITNYRKTSKKGYLTMGKFCGNANVNTTGLVPTEERVAGGITLPDREFATKEFPHSSCRFIAKFISRVLLWSLLTVVRNTLRLLSRLLVQLKSKWINQVKPSF